MKIAFDLDDTLILSDQNSFYDTPHWLAKLLGYEKLRQGTSSIFKFCDEQGWETWIYTTSYRKPSYIKLLFLLQGIKLHGVINQKRHENVVEVNCSKHPPSFGLDVVIDDSEGILIEAERFNFHAIWLKPENPDWVKELQRRLLDLRDRMEQE